MRQKLVNLLSVGAFVLFLGVMMVGCGATQEQIDNPELEVETLIVSDFYESETYDGYCYYKLSKFNSKGSVSDNVAKVLRPCGEYTIGDTLQ